jgi:hypothetical protein
MPFLKNTPHPALNYSIFKVKNFLSQLAQFSAHAHVGGKRWEGKGGGLLRFLFIMPHICRAVRGPRPVPGQLQIYALSD